jgi:hypothetical protein
MHAEGVAAPLTLFSIPRAFTGIYARLQHNALQNWAQILPPDNIVLFGDEEGVLEAAETYGCRHYSCQKNDFGTPVLSDVFSRIKAVSKTDYCAFVNADVLLDPNLQKVISGILAYADFSKSGFMGVARRWNLDVSEVLDMTLPESFVTLKKQALAANDLYPPVGMDLFVFPRNFFRAMPPFSIGWPGAKYDNWMLWYALSQKLPVVDMTDGVTLIHQNHPTGGGADAAKYVEHWRNLRFAGGYGHCYDLEDVRYTLSSDRMVSPHHKRRYRVWLRRLLQRCRDLCRFEVM